MLLYLRQGSQAIGMGHEFYKNFKVAKQIFQEADDKLNFKISKLILEGPEKRFKINSKYSASNFNNKLCYLFSCEKRI